MKVTTRIYFTIILPLISTAGQLTTAQTAPPPALGEETKVQQDITERNSINIATTKTTYPLSSHHSKAPRPLSSSVLGLTEVNEPELRSERLYRIKPEYSFGIKENDSDRQLSSDDNDLEDTYHLTNWKLSSW